MFQNNYGILVNAIVITNDKIYLPRNWPVISQNMTQFTPVLGEHPKNLPKKDLSFHTDSELDY